MGSIEIASDRASDNSTLIAIARAVKLDKIDIANQLKKQLTKPEHHDLAAELIGGVRSNNTGSAKFYQMLAGAIVF